MKQTGCSSGALCWPQRTCVGCRSQDRRSALLRIVVPRAGPDLAGHTGTHEVANRTGVVVLIPDVAARLPGRGAWIHPRPECLDLARRRRAFARALRVSAPVDLSAVEAEIESWSARQRTKGGPSTVEGP